MIDSARVLLPPGLDRAEVAEHLDERADAARDPVEPDVWWLADDPAYLAAVIGRRRAGKQTYAAKVTLGADAVTLGLDCLDSCLPPLRGFAGWLVDRGGSAATAEGDPATLDDLFG